MSNEINVNTAPEGGQAMEEALSALPDAVVRRISTIAARYGIRHDSDPMWALVEASQDGLECALAAGKAAHVVHRDVQKIPDQIYRGAVQAGDDLKGVLSKALEDKGVEIGSAVAEAVAVAGGQVVSNLQGAETALAAASTTFKVELDGAKATAISQGVEEFGNMALRAMDQRINTLSVRSALISGFVFSLCLGASAFLGVSLADLDGHVTQYRIAQAVGGGADCRKVAIAGVGKQYVCVMNQKSGFMKNWL